MHKRDLLLAAFVLLALTSAHAGAAREARSAGPLRLLSYGGVFQQGYTEAVLKPFAASRRTEIEFIGADTSAAMLERLRAERNDPKADVVIMDASTALTACAEGLVEPINPRLLPVLNDLYRSAREAGAECGPGVTFDHFVIVYDSGKTSPPRSLRALWNPAWRGRVALSAPPNILGLALTAILANADAADWRHADGAFRELRELAPSVATFNPQPDAYSVVLDGGAALAIGWNARAQFYRDRSHGRLDVVLPDEGTVSQVNTINVVRNAPHKAEALAFLAHALSPGPQTAFAERMFYAPTNSLVRLDPALEKRTAASLFDMARVIHVNWAELARLSPEWQQRWSREVLPFASPAAQNSAPQLRAPNSALPIRTTVAP